MKALKIILITLVVLIALLLIGVFIFLKTFDLNQYQSMITSQIKTQIGRDASFGDLDLKLSLGQGAVLNISKLVIWDDPQISSDPWLTVDQINLQLSLMEMILNRRVEVQSVKLTDPKLNLIIFDDGRTNIPQPQVASAKSLTPDWLTNPFSASVAHAQTAPGNQPAGNGILDQLTVEKFEIQNGTAVIDVRMREIFAKPLTVSSIDVVLDDVSFNDPFPFEIQCALFNAKQNFSGEGRLRIDVPAQNVRITDASIKHTLSSLELNRLTEFLPAIAQAKLERLEGDIVLTVPAALAGAKGLKELEAGLQLNNGVVKLAYFDQPFTSIEATLAADEKDMVVKSFEADAFSGNVFLEGDLNDYLTVRDVRFQATVNRLRIQDIISTFKLPVQVEGLINAAIQGQGKGLTLVDLSTNYTAEGQAEVVEGRIPEFNLLDVILDRLTIIPDFAKNMQTTLPPKYREYLTKDDTVIEEAKANVLMQNGVIRAPQVMVNADGLILEASASLAFDLRTRLDGRVIFPDELSEEMIQAVSEFQMLANDKGLISVPLKPFEGPLAQIRIMPDMELLGRNIFREKAKEEATKALRGLLGGEEEQPPTGDGQDQQPDTDGEGSQPAPKQKRPEEILLDSVLDSILK